MTETQKTWHILGAGAIGCLWAIRLHTEGIPVRLIVSERRLHTLKGKTLLELEFLHQAGQSSGRKIQLPVAHREERPQHLLLATKANDAVEALRNRKGSLRECRNVVTLCNGMGYHAAIQALLPATALFAVSTTDGAYFENEQRLVLAGIGTNKIARLVCESADHKRALEWASKQLSTRGHRLHTRQNANRMLMDKLLINACINGLTAIHNCRNGDLIDRTDIQITLNQLITECQGIAYAAGFSRSAKHLQERVYSVARATANNYSSTCIDIKLGRKTEIMYINAHLCSLADQLNLKAPANQKIVSAIQRLEYAGGRP